MTLFDEAAIRLAAFFRHMKRHGLEAGEEDVIDIRNDELGVQTYLASGPKHTAVVSSDDWIANSFIRHAPIYEVCVPEDLSVVGFDSTDFCNELRPTLTSVSQPLEVMGQSAVDLLVQSIRGETPDLPGMTLPCGLDIRGSTTFNP